MQTEDFEERPAATDDQDDRPQDEPASAHADETSVEEAAALDAEESLEDAADELTIAEELHEVAAAEAEAGDMDDAVRDEALAEAFEDAAAQDVAEALVDEAVVEELEAAREDAAPAEVAAEVEPEVLEPEAVESEAVEREAVAEATVEAPAEETLEVPEAQEPEEADGKLLRGPGEWYVVHTYSGYENKVKANLHQRIGSMQMEDKIFDVVIPLEDVMEIKGGKKQVVQRKVFPGYLLVRMIYDNDSWYVVRNTPGVTGFVSSGTGTKPTPLSQREVEKILAVKKDTEKKPEYRLEWEEGDVVRIVAGPFADFTGTISEINVEQSKLRVMVNIFDRETPVELAFDQVAKA